MVFLRPIGENDRERMLDILTSNQVNKTYMLPDFEHREDALPLFRRLMAMSQDPAKYVRAIALEDGLIGFLNQVEVEDGSIELGYVIHPDFQGKGCMTQALDLAIEELFQMEYRQVITGAFTENTASIRVMEKCGMTRMDKIDEIDYRGKTHTCIYYSKKRMVYSCCFCGEAATAREAYVLSIARAHDPEGPEQDIYCHRICLERRIKDKNCYTSNICNHRSNSMLKFPCLVLDHDDTVVQTLKTLSYPFWCLELEQFRPGQTMSLQDYALECYRWGFADMCRNVYGFTDEELALEHRQWNEYVMNHTPEIFPGIDRIIRRQKELGGMLFVVSHSNSEIIVRDYLAHFGILPDEIYGWDRPSHQRKPNPWPLEDIMAKHGFKREEILVVDDMQLSCQMAEPLGVATAFSGWDDMGVPQLREDMQKRCSFSFDSVAEFEKFLFD